MASAPGWSPPGPAMALVGIEEGEGVGAARCRILFQAQLEAPAERAMLMRAPVSVLDVRGRRLRTLDAVGVSRPREVLVEFVGETELPPGPYWIQDVASQRKWKIHWGGRGEAAERYCRHVGDGPSRCRVWWMSGRESGFLAGHQWWEVQACCGAEWSGGGPPTPNRYLLGLWIPVQGVMSVRVNGKAHQVSPGQYLVVNPESRSHFFGAPSYPVVLEKLYVDPVVLKRVREASRLPRLLGGFGFEERPRPLSGAVAEAWALWNRWGALRSGAVGRPWGESSLEALIMALINDHPNQLQGRAHRARLSAARDSRLQAAVRWIGDHLADPTALKRLSREAGASPEWLRRRFREVFQRSPGEYVMERRMQRAMALLRQPGATVDDVAHEVGYRGIRSFYEAFRAYAQVTPSHYRLGERRPPS